MGVEEVDAVTVEVAPSEVIVLCGAKVGMPSQGLGFSQRHPGVCARMTSRVGGGWADV